MDEELQRRLGEALASPGDAAGLRALIDVARRLGRVDVALASWVAGMEAAHPSVQVGRLMARVVAAAGVGAGDPRQRGEGRDQSWPRLLAVAREGALVLGAVEGRVVALRGEDLAAESWARFPAAPPGEGAVHRVTRAWPDRLGAAAAFELECLHDPLHPPWAVARLDLETMEWGAMRALEGGARVLDATPEAVLLSLGPEVRRLDLTTGERHRVAAPEPGRWPRAGALAPGGTRGAVLWSAPAVHDGEAFLAEYPDLRGPPHGVAAPHDRAEAALAYHPSQPGRILVAGILDPMSRARLVVWELRDGKLGPASALGSASTVPVACRWGSRGERFLVTCADGSGVLVGPGDRRRPTSFSTGASDPDSLLLVDQGLGHEPLDVETRGRTREAYAPRRSLRSLALSRDGRHLLGGSEDLVEVHAWRLPGLQLAGSHGGLGLFEGPLRGEGYGEVMPGFGTEQGLPVEVRLFGWSGGPREGAVVLPGEGVDRESVAVVDFDAAGRRALVAADGEEGVRHFLVALGDASSPVGLHRGEPWPRPAARFVHDDDAVARVWWDGRQLHALVADGESGAARERWAWVPSEVPTRTPEVRDAGGRLWVAVDGALWVLAPSREAARIVGLDASAPWAVSPDGDLLAYRAEEGVAWRTHDDPRPAGQLSLPPGTRVGALAWGLCGRDVFVADGGFLWRYVVGETQR